MNTSRLTGVIFGALLVVSGVDRVEAQAGPGGALSVRGSADDWQLGAVARDLGMLNLEAMQVRSEMPNEVFLSLIYGGEERELLLEPAGYGTAAISGLWDEGQWRAPTDWQDRSIELRFVDEEMADIWGGYGYVGTLDFSVEGSEYLGRMATEMLRAYGWIPGVVRVPCPSCLGVVPGAIAPGRVRPRVVEGPIGDLRWYTEEERALRSAKDDRAAILEDLLVALQGLGGETIWSGEIWNWHAVNESSGAAVFATSVQVVVPARWFGGDIQYWDSFDITIVSRGSAALSTFFGIQATEGWDLIVDGYKSTKAGGSVAPAPDDDFHCPGASAGPVRKGRSDSAETV